MQLSFDVPHSHSQTCISRHAAFGSSLSMKPLGHSFHSQLPAFSLVEAFFINSIFSGLSMKPLGHCFHSQLPAASLVEATFISSILSSFATCSLAARRIWFTHVTYVVCMTSAMPCLGLRIPCHRHEHGSHQSSCAATGNKANFSGLSG